MREAFQKSENRVERLALSRTTIEHKRDWMGNLIYTTTITNHYCDNCNGYIITTFERRFADGTVKTAKHFLPDTLLCHTCKCKH